MTGRVSSTGPGATATHTPLYSCEGEALGGSFEGGNLNCPEVGRQWKRTIDDLN